MQDSEIEACMRSLDEVYDQFVDESDLYVEHKRITEGLGLIVFFTLMEPVFSLYIVLLRSIDWLD